MKQYEKYVFLGIILAMIVNGASGWLLPPDSAITHIFTYFILGGAVVATLLLAGRLSLLYLTSGQYSVEAFILDSSNRLLVYRHPHHGKMLPPGGRLKWGEFPTDGLEARLKERLHLMRENYRYVEVSLAYLEPRRSFAHLQSLPTPFIVQREVLRQRRFKRFHYDFIYVLRMKSDPISFDSTEYQPVQFVNMQRLLEYSANNETFEDVVDTYRRILYLVENAPQLLERTIS
jgi:ADP-ribose pyrophosphatase YjhB (NUDIX family)